MHDAHLASAGVRPASRGKRALAHDRFPYFDRRAARDRFGDGTVARISSDCTASDDRNRVKAQHGHGPVLSFATDEPQVSVLAFGARLLASNARQRVRFVASARLLTLGN